VLKTVCWGILLLDTPEQSNAIGLSTHKIYNPEHDEILQLCNKLNLKNPGRKIHIIFSDAYLYGDDGVFNLTYEQILASCDLSIFPSFYEPWGYSPLESLAYSTLTVTTDIAGFGCWVTEHVKQDVKGVVFVLKRKGQDETKTVTDLNEYLFTVIKRQQDKVYITDICRRALQIAYLADWRFFYKGYLEAYNQAIKFNKLTQAALEITESDSQVVISIYDPVITLPRLRPLQYESILPERIAGLRKLAYNFWWSWHDDAKVLFQRIDPILWGETKHNPVHFLNLVSSQNLQRTAKDDDYVWLYNHVLEEFNNYMQTDCNLLKFSHVSSVNTHHPIAMVLMSAYLFILVV
jgi:phosphorylase/glycogen(starch) synthase